MPREKRDWNEVAARVAEFLAEHPGSNKEQLYSHIRLITGGCSLSNCALCCAHLGDALVSRKASFGTWLQHWIDGAKLPSAVSERLSPETRDAVLSSVVPEPAP